MGPKDLPTSKIPKLVAVKTGLEIAYMGCTSKKAGTNFRVSFDSSLTLTITKILFVN